MNCEKLETVIALYVEGDLPPRKARWVERHLMTCRACRAFTEELKLSQGALKRLGQVPAPEPSLERVRACVMNAAAIAGSPRSARLARVPHYAIAAGVILLVAISLVALRRRQNDTERMLATNHNRTADVMPRAGDHNAVRFHDSLRPAPAAFAGTRGARRRARLTASRSARPQHTQSQRSERVKTLVFGRKPALIPSRGYPADAYRYERTVRDGVESLERSRPPELKVKLVTDNPNIVIYMIVD
ncbi:MAG TPA: zf-HC2 domain-containing protein [Terriglobia bacterium]|nr:zf-HC2 domain-containing protein [Terriglobia bacterium]